MKTILFGLVLAVAVTLGLAGAAQAAPLHPIQVPVVAGHGHWGVGVGVGVAGGGYAPQPAGYYRTEYRWVPVTQFVGYDMYGGPVYTTTYVQQAYTVWVPAPRYYAPAYAYPRPTWSVGFGMGYRWR